jgi:hypothetical protein
MQSKHNYICIKQRDIQLHVSAFFWLGHHQVEVQEWVEELYFTAILWVDLRTNIEYFAIQH